MTVIGTVYFSSWLRSILPSIETVTETIKLREVFTSLQQILGGQRFVQTRQIIFECTDVKVYTPSGLN